MKKYIACLVVILTLGITGCKEALEVDRVGAIVPEQMWSNAAFLKYYVNGFYQALPTWEQYASYTEEAGQKTLSNFLRGMNASSDGFPQREWSYDKIRTINVFLDKIDHIEAILTDDEKRQLKGQAFFFRAYLYYMMVKVMGGVPIITTVLDPTADLSTLQFPRNTTLACFDFIIDELNTAIDLLPPKGTANYESSRITKAAAMALKGEVLLWKASPLFCKTKNMTYWNDAYTALTAAKTELDAQGYGLFDDGTAKTTENFWYNKEAANKEKIIYVEYLYPAKGNSHQAGQRPLSTSSGSAGANEPTWELVNAYPMNTGKEITDPTSNYNPDQFWLNRDPRFYNTVVYNGAIYGIGNKTNRRQWSFSGLDLDGYGTGWNVTGLYSRKGIDTTLTIENFSHQAFDWPIKRYAEVLLDIAECANEVEGHRSEARECIIQIRKRAHLLPGEGGQYGLAVGVGTDYQITLDAIMKERLIEFVYEGKRYNDLRRRRMFSVLNKMKKFHAYAPYVNLKKAAELNIGIDETSSVAEVVVALNSALSDPNLKNVNYILQKVTDYRVIPLDKNSESTIQIPERNYFAPLHQDWLKKNPMLKQNSGWDNGDFNPVIQ